MLPVYPEMTALNAVTNLLDYFNEVGSIGGKSMFVLNNMFAREILKLKRHRDRARDEDLHRPARTTRSSTSRR